MSDSVIKADVNKSPAFYESIVIKTNPIVLPVVFQPSVYGSHSFISTHAFKAERGAPVIMKVQTFQVPTNKVLP